MLELTVEGELYDESENEFITVGPRTVRFEHSLLSVSKWEQIYKKPFLADNDKSDEEIYHYFELMVVDANVPTNFISRLSNENIEEINELITDSATATWFSNNKITRPSTQTYTSELIYYWVFSLGISIEVELWHINRLLTLIRIYEAQNDKQSSTNKKTVPNMADRRALNEQRRRQYNTKG